MSVLSTRAPFPAPSADGKSCPHLFSWGQCGLGMEYLGTGMEITCCKCRQNFANGSVCSLEWIIYDKIPITNHRYPLFCGCRVRQFSADLTDQRGLRPQVELLRELSEFWILWPQFWRETKAEDQNETSALILSPRVWRGISTPTCLGACWSLQTNTANLTVLVRSH